MQEIILNPFVLRQTRTSQYSYWACTDQDLIARTRAAMEAGKTRPGYRDGVVLAQVDPEGIFSGTCVLKEGDVLVGSYNPRRPGEAPRKKNTCLVGGTKLPAVSVDVVLYSSETLAEDGSNKLAPEPGNWEIISVNAQAVEGEEPIHPGTLMYNHFHEKGSDDGGTSTGMTDAEFVALLRTGFLYWRDKANAAP